MIDCVRHAVLELEAAGSVFDAICLLQPTAPLRTAAQIDGCLAMLESGSFDAAMTVVPIPVEYHPEWAYRPCGGGRLDLWSGASQPVSRRQDLPEAYCRSGDVYVTRRDVVVERRSLYGASVAGFPIDPARTINLNEPDDWRRAEAMLAARDAANAPVRPGSLSA
jgi:CMP-N-acetylneuraminic acid synthetase